MAHPNLHVPTALGRSVRSGPGERRPPRRRWLAAGSGVAFLVGVLLSATQCTNIAGLEELSFGGGGAGAGVGSGGDGANGQGGGACGPPGEPPGGSCPLQVCTGGCVDGDTCVVDCSGNDDPCVGETVDCPAGFDCLIQCGDDSSCSGAALNCPPDYQCLVQCSGPYACVATDINCSQTGHCALACGVDSQSCDGATLYCAGGPCLATCSGASKPELECGESCNCLPCD